MERCLFNSIKDYVIGLISKCQHGFIAGRSCVTQLVDVLDYIGAQLDNGGQVDTVYLDMSKAFDKVSHPKLLKRLRDLGIGGRLLNWFESYLHNRLQKVTALGVSSQTLQVTSGVPQGSILGPVLFLLYVNTLPDAVHSTEIATFADDTKIYKTIRSPGDTQLLQKDLNSLTSWSTSTDLIFNKTKCKAQRITRKINPIVSEYYMHGASLSATTDEKDLGVYISNNLTWVKQVSEQCTKSNRMLGFVRRNTRFITRTSVRRSIYLTLVRCHLGYATQIWAPQSKELIRKIERVQRRATKYILNLPFRCSESYKDRLVKLNLLPLTYWHEYLDLVFFFKAITGIITVNTGVLPAVRLTRVTRNNNSNVTQFITRKCKTTTFQRSFFNRATRLWNILANDLQLTLSLPLSTFKSILMEYYKNALVQSYDPEDARSWKTICTSCNVARNMSRRLTCCF
jgi:hypothetical protein